MSSTNLVTFSRGLVLCLNISKYFKHLYVSYGLVQTDLSRYNIACIEMSVGAVLFMRCGSGLVAVEGKVCLWKVVGPNTSINVCVVGHWFKEKTDFYVVAEVVSRFIILQSDISKFVTY